MGPCPFSRLAPSLTIIILHIFLLLKRKQLLSALFDHCAHKTPIKVKSLVFYSKVDSLLVFIYADKC
jgi:hypothetical protein